MSIASSTASMTWFEFVAQMGEIEGVVPFQHVAQRHDLVAPGIAAGRREKTGREAEGAGRECLFE